MPTFVEKLFSIGHALISQPLCTGIGPYANSKNKDIDTKPHNNHNPSGQEPPIVVVPESPPPPPKQTKTVWGGRRHRMRGRRFQRKLLLFFDTLHFYHILHLTCVTKWLCWILRIEHKTVLVSVTFVHHTTFTCYTKMDTFCGSYTDRNPLQPTFLVHRYHTCIEVFHRSSWFCLHRYLNT